MLFIIISLCIQGFDLSLIMSCIICFNDISQFSSYKSPSSFLVKLILEIFIIFLLLLFRLIFANPVLTASIVRKDLFLKFYLIFSSLSKLPTNAGSFLVQSLRFSNCIIILDLDNILFYLLFDVISSFSTELALQYASH